jgi:hypothetical protein
MMLKAAMSVHLGLKSTMIENYFDAQDHQNVPKTIRLLQDIYNLSQVPDFASQQVNQPMVLLGRLLRCLILPYIILNFHPTLFLNNFHHFWPLHILL